MIEFVLSEKGEELILDGPPSKSLLDFGISFYSPNEESVVNRESVCVTFFRLLQPFNEVGQDQPRILLLRAGENFQR